MTDWRSLRDAYGTAEEVEALLDRADSDDRAVWDELWGRLCHQGTVQTASYAAIPRLTDLALGRPPTGYVEPLHLAACIIASTDGPDEPSAVRKRYRDAVRTLNQLAERNLALARSETEFIYGVQALLATEATSVWTTELEALANEELEFACPHCTEQLVLDLGASPAVKPFEDEAGGTSSPLAADPASLTGVEERAHRLAIQHARQDLAARMLVLFGRFTCPRCGFSGEIASALR